MKKLLILMGFCSLILVSGCKDEDKANAMVTVYVTNSNGNPVQNAMVRMYVPTTPDGEINFFKTTSIDGAVSFQWRYQVYVTFDAVKGGFRGCNSGMIMPGEETEINLIMLRSENPANGCID